MNDQPQEQELVLRCSHNIIDHLGLKLYQNRPTNVLAELVANAWDAGAEHVWIDLRTSLDLGERRNISVADDGSGMTLSTLAKSYLIIGLPKDRQPYTNGPRYPMGRKGIGKLAPFGIAQSINILTVARNGGTRSATWIKLDSENIRGQKADVKPLEQTIYMPEVLYRGVDPTIIDSSSDPTGSVKAFLDRIDGKSGTLVLLSHLSLLREITASAVRESMGRRFTVTLARPETASRPSSSGNDSNCRRVCTSCTCTALSCVF